MKRLGYKKIEVAGIFDGIDHGNYCMTDIGVVGGKHKSIRRSIPNLHQWTFLARKTKLLKFLLRSFAFISSQLRTRLEGESIRHKI